MNTPHPTDDQLQAYRADPAGHTAIDAHLRTCPDCRRRAVSPRTPTPAPWPTHTQAQAPPVFANDGSVLPPELAALGQYEDIRVLGRGGMGVVYLATNRLMDRKEVLKVIGRELLDRPDVADRFLREVRSAARLNHPNVVTAYSAARTGDLLVFAMEYVPGRNLSELVKADGPLPVPTACEYVWQAAQGLQHAHEKGMIHRDIKPGNLMLLEKGRRPVVKVLDFGLAKSAGGPRRTDMTAAGQMLGTPDYMAPEQESDAADADIRADVYALGGTLHFLLTGRPPYVRDSLFDLLLAHKTEPPPRLDLLRPDVPAEVADLLVRMLGKSPDARPHTPGEVVKVLDRHRKPARRSVLPTAPRLPQPSPPAPPKPPMPVIEPLVPLTPAPEPPAYPPMPPRRTVQPVQKPNVVRRVGRFARWLATWTVILIIWFGTLRFLQLLFLPLPGDRPIPVMFRDYKGQAADWWNGLTK